MWNLRLGKSCAPLKTANKCMPSHGSSPLLSAPVSCFQSGYTIASPCVMHFVSDEYSILDLRFVIEFVILRRSLLVQITNLKSKTRNVFTSSYPPRHRPGSN